MGIVELLLTAIGLSMDAFAVSVCKGLGMRKMRYDQAFGHRVVFRRVSGTDAAVGLAAGYIIFLLYSGV
mgnify:CR=1 FL=1